MSSRNPSSASSSPTSHETKTPQTPSKQQESPFEITPNQENTQLLLPDSTEEQAVDAIFLTSLLGYKVSVGSLPSFDDGLLTEQGQQLLDHVNADPDNVEFIDETLLRAKVLKLYSKYKKNLEEGRAKADEDDLSTDSEKLIFMLSERIWNPEYDDYGFPEVNVEQEVAVSGNRQGARDQDDQELFLFPDSTCEEDDDIATLVNVNIYGVYDESFLPSFLHHSGQRHSLADFINSNRKNRGRVNEARLRDKVLKLQTRYKEIVEEKGKDLNDEDFSTYNEHLIFRLSRMAWGKEPEANADQEVSAVMEANVNHEVDAVMKANVNQEVDAIMEADVNQEAS